MTPPVCLPNPQQPEGTFGRQMSRWARPESAKRMGRTDEDAVADEDDGGGNTPEKVPPVVAVESCVCASCGPQAMIIPAEQSLGIKLGFWRNRLKPRHMELTIDIFKAEETCNANKGLIGNLAGENEPLWTLNAYMGGDIISALKSKDVSSSNPKVNAPMALDVDISRRSWSLNGKIVRRETFGEFQMTASEFVSTLRRFIRWGFAVGSSQKFRFHPFLFKHDDLTPRIGRFDEKDVFEEDLSFINCQGSVALFALWWLTEVRFKVLGTNRLIDTPFRDVRDSDKNSESEDAIAKRVARQIAPHILIKYFRALLSGNLERTAREGKERLETFLTSDPVKDALKWDEEKVTSEIEHYEAEKSSKSQ